MKLSYLPEEILMADKSVLDLEHEPLYPFLSDKKAWRIVVQELRLSPRQAEIVRLILLGKQQKEIARELDRTVPTIQTQLDRVYRRNGVGDHKDLILKIFGLAWQMKLS